jgi:hypothetical protein
MQHVTADGSCVDEAMFNDGYAFDGSSIAGWKGIEASDMTLMPDPASAHLDPFFAQTTMAVFGSGISSMSEASMPFQPATDEPSKAWPELNLSSSKCETGTVTCCSFPRVSVKRKSTNFTSFSFTIFITSATVLAAIKVLLVDGC